MNPELLKVVLNRAELMFNSAFDNARQVSNRFAAVESVNTGPKDTDLGSLIGQVASHQKELLYRLDQAAPRSPFAELSELHEPVNQFRSVLDDLLASLERGEPFAQIKGLFANLERVANLGRSCIKSIRESSVSDAAGATKGKSQTPRKTPSRNRPSTEAQCDLPTEFELNKKQRRRNLYIEHFGMPECSSEDEARDWAIAFQDFLDYVEAVVVMLNLVRIHALDVSSDPFLPRMLLSDGTLATGSSLRENCFRQLKATEDALKCFIDLISDVLALKKPVVSGEVSFYVAKQQASTLADCLPTLGGVSGLSSQANLCTELAPILEVVTKSPQQSQVLITLSQDKALELLSLARPIQARLGELLLSARTALRLGVLPPDFGGRPAGTQSASSISSGGLLNSPAFKRLKPCQQLAYISYLVACERKGVEHLIDHVAYEELQENDFQVEYKNKGYKLPSLPTWISHLSKARAGLGEQKYTKRRR